MALLVRTTANKYSFVNNYCNHLTLINTELRKFSVFTRSRFISKYLDANIHNTANFYNVKIPSNSSNTTQRKDTIKKGKSFEMLIAQRRDEAKRSVVIQVHSPDSYTDLYSYCNKFGRINKAFYYVNSKNSYFIIEFEELSSQQALFNATVHLNHSEIIPVKSQLLWFRNASVKGYDKLSQVVPRYIQIGGIPDDRNFNKVLSEVNSVSEQMELLYDKYKLDDVAIRLRFLTAYQVEAGFLSLFPNICVYPFGSSVNGFGKKGCDLDIVLILESNTTDKHNSRLVFHTKSALSDERTQTQRSMETIANVMQHFMPGVLNVRRILRAKVPIIKYDNGITGLECDLSMTNMIAVYMTELLFLYGEFHSQVRPLVFTIRQWASSVAITNSTPGFWISNFSLTLLVLFFLQCKQILPSINTLKHHAEISDVRLTETCTDCTFMRDITKWPKMNGFNNISLEHLLGDFYNFYAHFDFATKAISLRDGASVIKPDSSPLFICNPLEITKNVSKNVSHTEIMKFINAARNAALLINQDSHQNGLVDIFTQKRPDKSYFVNGSMPNKINIMKIFNVKDTNEEIPQNNSMSKRHVRRR